MLGSAFILSPSKDTASGLPLLIWPLGLIVVVVLITFKFMSNVYNSGFLLL